jgi:uncharacterized membrane protein YdjX (TVP38/TMEM64 family)
LSAGALFGLTVGVLVVVTGGLLGATLQYVLAHRLLRHQVSKALERWPSLELIQRSMQPREVRFQFLVRLTPLNPTTYSYILGAAGVPFAGFMLAALGLLPGYFVETYFGYAGRHIASIAGRGYSSPLHDISVIVGLAVSVAVVVLVSRAAAWAIHRAGTENVNAAYARDARAASGNWPI